MEIIQFHVEGIYFEYHSKHLQWISFDYLSFDDMNSYTVTASQQLIVYCFFLVLKTKIAYADEKCDANNYLLHYLYTTMKFPNLNSFRGLLAFHRKVYFSM